MSIFDGFLTEVVYNTYMLQEVIGELLRTVAYIAEREEEGTVNYDTLQADFLKPMANKSALQEIGLFLPIII
jgi:hypothetical protein